MKKKLLIFTLCFTLIFSSLNYKKSYAVDFAITPAMFYTVSALAVSYGLTIQNEDALYNLAREFVDFTKDTYSDVNEIFKSCVSLGVNGVVTVGKEFLDIFNSYIESNKSRVLFDNLDFDYDTFMGLPVYNKGNLGSSYQSAVWALPNGTFRVDRDKYLIYINDILIYDYSNDFYRNYYFNGFYINNGMLCGVWNLGQYHHRITGTLDSYFDGWTGEVIPNPLVGRYDDTFVNNNLDDKGNLGLVLNPDVGSLVGKAPGDIIYDGTNSGSYDGSISIPVVSNPNVSLEGDMFFPGTIVDSPDISVPSVPSDGIWANIKDFVISLVVPNDTFWTDTWGGLYNNFTNSFPMVDMDAFNDLVTGEKKFPNIDINIMGVIGRVVNGDVINSIVDWLRPIIAGFMMLCLMFFNYRKIYKLIRNSEPFPGIAQGTSDFKTGISEYNWRDNFVDIHSEYQKYKEGR